MKDIARQSVDIITNNQGEPHVLQQKMTVYTPAVLVRPWRDPATPRRCDAACHSRAKVYPGTYDHPGPWDTERSSPSNATTGGSTATVRSGAGA